VVLSVKESSIGSHDDLLLARELIGRSSYSLDHLPMVEVLPVRALLFASVLPARLLAAVTGLGLCQRVISPKGLGAFRKLSAKSILSKDCL
jgi:hypothetical protein